MSTLAVERPSYAAVRESIESAMSSLEAAAEQIVWQVENRAWEVLGYESWDVMRDAEYGGAAFMVPRAERPELVARLRRSGLTQQSIADTAGVSVGTINADLNFSSENDQPASVTNARGQSRPASYTRPAPVSVGVGEAGADVPASDDPAPAEARPQNTSPTIPQGEPVSRAVGEASAPVSLSPPTGGDTGPTPASVTRLADRRPAPKPTPSHLKPVRSGEQQNAEENSRTLASSLIFLLAFQHPTQRDTARIEWETGSEAVAPTTRGYVTPDRMRQAAEGLRLLADEWESTHE